MTNVQSHFKNSGDSVRSSLQSGNCPDCEGGQTLELGPGETNINPPEIWDVKYLC